MKMEGTEMRDAEIGEEREREEKDIKFVEGWERKGQKERKRERYEYERERERERWR